MTSVLVHTVLYHGQSLLNGLKRVKVEPDDIHAKLMRNYPEVPDWWYGLSFVLCFSLAIVAVEVSPHSLRVASVSYMRRSGTHLSLCGYSYWPF